MRPAPLRPRQITVDKGHERSVFVCVDRVVAERNDCRLVTRSVDVTRDGTMAEAQQTLGPEKFVRLNRTDFVSTRWPCSSRSLTTTPASR